MRINTGATVSNPLARYAAAKLAVADAAAELEEAKGEVVAYLKQQRMKTVTRQLDGGVRQTFTVARKTDTVVDEGGLSAALGKRVTNRFYKQKFSNALLEAAIEAGKVDGKVVAPFLTLKEGAPYVVFTETEDEPDAP